MHWPTNEIHKEIIDIERRDRGGSIEGLTAWWKAWRQRSSGGHNTIEIRGASWQTQLHSKDSGVIRCMAYGGRKWVADKGAVIEGEDYDSQFQRGASSARCGSGRVQRENLRIRVDDNIEEGGIRPQLHASSLRYFDGSSGNNGRFLRD
ncbi:hypothetical protein HN873_034791 [Arachis hypogaea]